MDDLFTQQYISNREVLQSLLDVVITESDWERIGTIAGNSVRNQVISQASLAEKFVA